MPNLTIELEEIFKLIDQLDKRNKIEIFERLKPQVLTEKWNTLFSRIDLKIKMKPISEKEIQKEVDRAREEISSSRC